MRHIYRLQNAIQQYEWGSRTAIPEFLGIPNPDGRPMAELWMGAHPLAPSRLSPGTESVRLDRFIEEHPELTLGTASVERFGPRLPFLFKLLAAGEPLSIQAHPNLDQAEAGFERETRQGIPLDAPHRTYRDRNHKPEVIAALTPFTALRGFRPLPELIHEFSAPPCLVAEGIVEQLAGEGSRGSLTRLFMSLQEIPRDRVPELVSGLLSRHEVETGSRYEWVRRLHERYPGDPGVFAPLYLNLVTLAPGEAMCLPAGELHAYLEGTGMELMANSDNVLRGGLTAKHVDVEELVSVLTFQTGTPEILLPEYGVERDNRDERIGSYRSPFPEFSLSVVKPDGSGNRGVLIRPRSAEILFCAGGSISLLEAGEGEVGACVVAGEVGAVDSEGGTGGSAGEAPGDRTGRITAGSAGAEGERAGVLTFRKGESVFVAAGAGAYVVEGEGTLYRARVSYENLG